MAEGDSPRRAVGDKVIQWEYNATISTHEKKYLTFVHSPRQYFYKKLFKVSNLGKALLTMSENKNKALPKGLQDEEVEREGENKTTTSTIHTSSGSNNERLRE